MKKGFFGILISCLISVLLPAWAEAENKEDADLDFLPLGSSEDHTDSIYQDSDITPINGQDLKITLDNTYQIFDSKDKNEQLFRLPSENNSNWANLTRLGLRGDIYSGSVVSFGTDMLLNAYSRDNESFNATDDLRLDIKEAYLSWQQSPARFIDTGRINVKNGVATGFNPTDYFKIGTVLDRNTEDVSQLRDSRVGSLLIKGQMLWDRGSLVLVASPKISYKSNRWYSDSDIIGLNLQKSNDRSRVLLKYTLKVRDDFSPELIYYNESGKHNIGFNLSTAFSKKWLGYVEWNMGKRRSLIDEALLEVRESNQLDPAIDQAFSDDKGEHYLQQLAIGASFTSASYITTTLEYDYNEAGLANENAERWLDLGTGAEKHPIATGQLLSVRGLAQARGEPLGEHSLFLRVTWADAGFDDLDLAGILVSDLNDKSHLVQVEARYNLNHRAELSLRLAKFDGDRKSLYGSLDKEQTVTLQVEYSF